MSHDHPDSDVLFPVSSKSGPVLDYRLIPIDQVLVDQLPDAESGDCLEE